MRKKLISRVLAVTILLAVILSVNYIAGLSFDKPRDADYYNYDVKRLEKEHIPVDLIIVGASQVYLGCNVDVISGEMQIGEVVDCAAPVGYVDGLYYMLRDLLRRFEPKCVVIDMNWRKFLEDEDPGSRFGMYLCADRLNWPDKLDFALHCYELSDWPNFFPVYRYGKSVWSLSQLRRNYRNKKAVAESRFDIDDHYRKNGYNWAVRSCPQGSLPAQDKNYSEEQISGYNIRYIRKTWEICQEKDIPVVWMTIPGSMEEVLSVSHYQEAIDDIGEFVKELGGTYLNFSYLKNREELFPDPLFADKLHLNGEGSIVFGRIFADALTKTLNGEDVSDMFYRDLDELKKDVHRIVACNGRVRANGDGTLTVEAKSLQGADETPEFRLMLIDGSKTVMVDGDAADDDAVSDVPLPSSEIRQLRPWQEETTFLINEDEIPEGYVLRLEAGRKGLGTMDAYVNNLTAQYQTNRVILK